MHQASAIGAVNADSPALGDKAGNRIAGQRLATAGHMGEQVANPANLHLAAVTAAPRRGQLELGGTGFHQPLGGVHHLGGRQVAGPHRRVHILHRTLLYLACHPQVIDAGQCQALELALQQAAAGGDIHLPGLGPEPVLHLGSGPGGAQVPQAGLQPVAARHAILAGQYLHPLPGGQGIGEGNDGTVDLGAATAVPHFGMDVVGKIQRGRSLGQIDNIPLGREYVDTVLGRLETELLRHLAHVTGFVMPVQHLPQPGDLFLVGTGQLVGCIRALVLPVGAHPEFRLLMHVESANLHLQYLALGPDDRGMQGAIAVLLGVGDVIVKLVGDVVPQTVHQAQGGIAVTDFRHQDAHGANIVDLGKTDALALHFSPDTVDMLGAPADLEGEPGVAQHLGKLLFHLGDELVPFHPLAIQQAGDLAVGISVQVAEGQVLQFPLELAYAQSMRQRRVDIEHFAGHRQPALLVVLDSAESAGSLRQLDQGNAHIVHQGDQHFANIVFLAQCLAQHGAVAGAAQLANRGHSHNALEQRDHRLAELGLYLLRCQALLPQGAVQHSGYQAIATHLQFRQDDRDIQASGETIHFPGPVTGVDTGLQANSLNQATGAQQARLFAGSQLDGQSLQPLVQVDSPAGPQMRLVADLHHT